MTNQLYYGGDMNVFSGPSRGKGQHPSATRQGHCPDCLFLQLRQTLCQGGVLCLQFRKLLGLDGQLLGLHADLLLLALQFVE